MAAQYNKNSVKSCFSVQQLNSFYEMYKEVYDEKTISSMMTHIDSTLEDYPPTKDQEMMLSKIKLGDAAFERHWDEKKQDSLLLSKIDNLSNDGVHKEIENTCNNNDAFVTFIGMNGKILLITETMPFPWNRMVYWHGKLGWLLVGPGHLNYPLLLIHIDVPEYYRFAFNLFHNKDGTHRIPQLSDSLWRQPTTEKSLPPPFYRYNEIPTNGECAGECVGHEDDL